MKSRAVALLTPSQRACAFRRYNLGLKNQSTTPNPFNQKFAVVYELEVSHDRKN